MTAAPSPGASPRADSRRGLQSRIGGLDAARGLALVGMLYAHTIPDGRTETVFDGRSSILFATIAGVSLGLMAGGERRSPRGRRSRVALSVAIRALILIALGIGLTLLDTPIAVILDTYGFLFLVMIPLLFAPWVVVAIVAAAAAVVGPLLVDVLHRTAADPSSPFAAAVADWAYYPYQWVAGHYPGLVWLAYLAVGLLMARAGIRRAGTQLALVVAGGAVALLVYSGGTLLGEPVLEHTNTTWEVLAGAGVAAVVIGVLTWLTESTPTAMRRAASGILYPLRAAGAMPVTLYTAQIIAIAIWMRTDAGDGGFLSWQSVPLFVVMLVASLLFASLWHLVFAQGPLEWLISRLARQRPWRRPRAVSETQGDAVTPSA